MKPTCSGLWQSMGLLSAVVLGLAGISHAEVSGYEKSELMIAMRDGVRLHTLVYRPSQAGRTAADHAAENALRRRQGRARALDDYLKDLADDGYLFVFQDIRGRYKSEGTFVMIRARAGPRTRRPLTKEPTPLTRSTGSSRS